MTLLLKLKLFVWRASSCSIRYCCCGVLGALSAWSKFSVCLEMLTDNKQGRKYSPHCEEQKDRGKGNFLGSSGPGKVLTSVCHRQYFKGEKNPILSIQGDTSSLIQPWETRRVSVQGGLQGSCQTQAALSTPCQCLFIYLSTEIAQAVCYSRSWESVRGKQDTQFSVES